MRSLGRICGSDASMLVNPPMPYWGNPVPSFFVSSGLVLIASMASAMPVQWVAGNGHFYEAFNSPVPLGSAITSAESLMDVSRVPWK